MKMKEKRVIYLEDSFTDYEGHVRPVTMCVISFEFDPGFYVSDMLAETLRGSHPIIPKICSLGIAVGHINDKTKWDSELGKRIAYQKAKNICEDSHMIMATDKGYISSELVDAWLKKEMDHFKKDPGYYIKGYNQGKLKFDESKIKEKINPEIEKFKELRKAACDIFESLTDSQKYILMKNV